LVLRETIADCLQETQQERCWTLVGTCYAHGLMNYEGILGHLPDHITTVIRFADEYREYCNHYKDERSGEVSMADPRISPLRSKLSENGVFRRARDPLEFSQRTGIDLSVFVLV
jgi:hypothetical protein